MKLTRLAATAALTATIVSGVGISAAGASTHPTKSDRAACHQVANGATRYTAAQKLQRSHASGAIRAAAKHFVLDLHKDRDLVRACHLTFPKDKALSATWSTYTAPVTTVPPAPTLPPPPPAPVETPGQSNARRSAAEYLSMGNGFSREGLIQQLSSSFGEGFSLDDATYGVDATHTDWNAQACLSAKGYLKMEAFSHAGLAEQLSSSYGEKYTPDEAEYGVTCAGI